MAEALFPVILGGLFPVVQVTSKSIYASKQSVAPIGKGGGFGREETWVTTAIAAVLLEETNWLIIDFATADIPGQKVAEPNKLTIQKVWSAEEAMLLTLAAHRTFLGEVNQKVVAENLEFGPKYAEFCKALLLDLPEGAVVYDAAVRRGRA